MMSVYNTTCSRQPSTVTPLAILLLGGVKISGAHTSSKTLCTSLLNHLLNYFMNCFITRMTTSIKSKAQKSFFYFFCSLGDKPMNNQQIICLKLNDIGNQHKTMQTATLNRSREKRNSPIVLRTISQKGELMGK